MQNGKTQQNGGRIFGRLEFTNNVYTDLSAR
jgi:hypothetical protein